MIYVKIFSDGFSCVLCFVLWVSILLTLVLLPISWVQMDQVCLLDEIPLQRLGKVEVLVMWYNFGEYLIVFQNEGKYTHFNFLWSDHLTVFLAFCFMFILLNNREPE